MARMHSDLFKLSVMQGRPNERRGSRRLQRRWSEISDILQGEDISIPRRLGDFNLGSIVSSPIVVWPGGKALSANTNAF